MGWERGIKDDHDFWWEKLGEWRYWFTEIGRTVSKAGFYKAGEQDLSFRDFLGFPGGTSGKEFTCQCRRHGTNTGDIDPVPGSGRSPGVGSGTPLQYSLYIYNFIFA